MRPRHRIIPLLSLTVLTWGLVSLGSIGVACATNHRIVVFTSFPQETNAFAHPMYWAPEGGQATFTMVRLSHDCMSDAVTVNYAVNGDTATPPDDFPTTSGTSQGMYDPESPTGGSTTAAVTVNISGADGVDGLGVEQARIGLSNPTAGAILGVPAEVPLLIVDTDGGARVSFDPGPYAQSESYSQSGQARIPVFRAGDVTAGTTVNYSIGSGATNPATPGSDFTGNMTGTLTFQPNDRVEHISFTLVNDQDAEQPEEVAVSLSSPTGGALDSPSAMTFTILDNEELNPPNSRFHHPRQGLKYEHKDYRIREVHVFTADEPGGSGVVEVEWAIRRNLKSGTCQWWTGKKARFKKGACQDEVWHGMGVYEPGAFYYDRLASLRPSIGTKVKSYTAFSRAIDGARNVESAFNAKRNMNTFEVKRK